ncbi:SDR family oxidoreductase [Pseudoalteromonas sp. SR45-1]|uniref:NAD-dependent epimerase/dehydratase family protein n=1 Tax=Pseudoalteromonas TaxID=53246 RepID=UPI00160428CF|nr:SDR family oxidoreductase [Pseudoalteromonas sp. SR45-1]MBB1325774.1 SDR family oxidoreductase [Pseudoalteromonas sp. SR45-1]|tara:strand:+ start:6893 stop:7723 length:831 start_codon:yes stop_codon:yes gene_type:complete
MALYTIFGGRGFIGSEIANQLKGLGEDVFIPARDDKNIFERELGIVIYCAGNGDCKNEPFSVFEANVSLLAKLLEVAKFTRLIYISSTRVYMNQKQSSEKHDLTVCADDNRRLFNLTKLVAEELCLKSGRDVSILRPSNVYGAALNSPLFLPAITRNAISKGKVDMYINKTYSKDYVSVHDVANCCIKISNNKNSLQKIINIAAGYNIRAEQIADLLQANTGCEIIWHDIDFPNEQFPVTDITTLKMLMPDYTPSNVLDDISDMIISFKEKMTLEL